MKILKMKNIQKSFGELEVLKNISIEVEEGEVVAIIGPSGSGKSTLLRCATELETPDFGEITYAENEAKGKSFGLVFQNFNLFPHYSVLKNIMDAPINVQKDKKTKWKYKQELCLRKWGWKIRRMPIHISYQVDNSNVFPLQGLCV